MNKMKFIIFVVALFFLTGCDAKYQLDIDNKNVYETLFIENYNYTEEQKQLFETNGITKDINDPCFLDYDSYEIDDKKVNDSKKYYNLKFNNNSINVTGEIPISKYNNSRIANLLFAKLNVNNYDNMFSIYGYDGVQIFDLYPELDNVTVSIKVDKKVVENNADKINGNSYIWNFNKNNVSKTLYIEMNPKEDYVTNTDNKKVILILFLGILAIFILILVYIKLKKKKFS